MRFGRPEPTRRFGDSGRLRLEERPEGFGEGRAAPIAVRSDVEGPRDLEVADPEAPHEAAPALLFDGTLGNHGDAHPGLDRLLDGLGRAHLAHDPEGREVLARLGERRLEGGTGAGSLLPQ